jgi:hypothetical protein
MEVYMGDSIIKSIIAYDKLAQEKVSALNEEVSQLSRTLSSLKYKLETELESEIKTTTLNTKNKLDLELKEKSLKAENQFNESFEYINKIFSENKDKWVDTIFKRIIK